MKSLSALLLVGIVAPGLASAETLGRLFHTPQQRARLDLLRQADVAVDREKTPVLVLDGEVRRSNGQDTYWLNGRARDGRRPTVLRSIAAGDRLDLRTGEQHPLLPAGALHIAPR